jgi:hypothetical protein
MKRYHGVISSYFMAVALVVANAPAHGRRAECKRRLIQCIPVIISHTLNKAFCAGIRYTNSWLAWNGRHDALGLGVTPGCINEIG